MHAVEHSHYVVAHEKSFLSEWKQNTAGWWGFLYKSGFMRYSDDVIRKAEC